MSDLLEKIKRAQVHAGEQAVIENLRSMGLAPPAPPDPRDARIAELERENQSMRADWKAICDAAESMPAGTVEFQLRQRIAHLEEALREAIEWNWMQDSVPTEVIDQVATALGVPATEL